MTDTDHTPIADAGEPAPESNALGLAGFIISLVGLCSGGVLSPIGLILSLVAMFRRPRGFAIAGFVLGLLGSIWVALVMIVIGFAVVAAVVAGLIAGAGPLEATMDAFQIRSAVSEYQDANDGAWPATVDDLTSLDADTLQDHWGRPYRVELNPGAGQVQIFSDGPDGQPDTDDDIHVSMHAG